jgi:hypothetical protein
MTLAVEEFLRRFLLHVLPPGFVRIRHFGFLAPRRRTALLPFFSSSWDDPRICRPHPNRRPPTRKASCSPCLLAPSGPAPGVAGVIPDCDCGPGKVAAERAMPANGAPPSRAVYLRLKITSVMVSKSKALQSLGIEIRHCEMTPRLTVRPDWR